MRWMARRLAVLLGAGLAAAGCGTQATVDAGGDLRQKALAAPAAALAQGYLAVAYNLLAVRVAQSGGTIVTTLDGSPTRITKANADAYAADYAARLATYDAAIRQRGFRQLAGRYAMAAGAGCAQLGFFDGPATIEQTDFKIKLASGSPPKSDGIVVEDAVAIEHALNPDIHLVGTASAQGIELHAGGCAITLTRTG